ncbi:ankyrin repeat-containing domain protein [Baffinella frigidus]|nr:ankyrin repeat-containing domain protein [Cryptophyta sp. CCMP2293]
MNFLFQQHPPAAAPQPPGAVPPGAGEALEAENLEEQLWEASRRGAVKELSQLLARGVDPTGRDGDSLETALHAAARGGHVQAALKLVEAGVDIAAASYAGRTALHLACRAGHAKISEALLQLGADPDFAGADMLCGRNHL